MQYRRARIKGGTYFFTLVTCNRNKIFADEKNIQLLREAFAYVIDGHHFTIDAHVILPEHLHFIWTLPEDDQNFSIRWQLIKSYFSRNFPSPKPKQAIWQRRFWEHCISNDKDMKNHVEYIHYNPVKHGYVKAPYEWPLSSFHRYVQNGMYEKDWGTTEEIVFTDRVGKE